MCALAVLNNGNVVSGSSDKDKTLKVWDTAQGMGQCGAWGTSADWQFMGLGGASGPSSQELPSLPYSAPPMGVHF